MENASKALIMAAEVLIGILILSLMVYLFVSFGSSAAEVNEEVDKTRLAEFNSQFDKYKDKNDITAYDILSLTNLATENNKYYGYDKPVGPNIRNDNSNYYIAISLQYLGYIEGTDSKELIDILLKNEVGEDYSSHKYECKNVKYSPITGRIKSMEFRIIN